MPERHDAIVLGVGGMGSATLFHLLGLDPHAEIRDALNRPLPISTGSVINGVLA